MKLLNTILCLLPLFAMAQSPVVQRDTVVCDSIVWGDTTYRFGASNPNYWTTVTLFDTVATDSIVRWNIRINASTQTIDSVVACNSCSWHGIAFALPPGAGSLTFDTALVGTNIAGCPLYRRLHLSLLGSDTSHLHQQACDQYYWPLTDRTLFLSGTYPCLFSNQQGCDSTVLLHLTIHSSSVTVHEDSICQGSSYQFYGRTLTTSGHYNENYTATLPPHCDSIIVLMLTVLPRPTITFDHWVDCDSLLHNVTVHTPVDYIAWSTSPTDPMIALQEHRRTIQVNPSLSTTYTLYADYYAAPTCPNEASITLAHIHPLHAEMSIIPPRISIDEPHFEARDLTAHALGRYWYVDEEYITSLIAFEHDADILADTIRVMLDAYNAYCHDTALTLLPLHRSTTFTPNAFTPDQPTNNRFFFPWTGISEFHLSIYNRGGLLVFSTDDITQSWDGTHNGTPCPPGAYVWHVQYTDDVKPHNPQVKEGIVTLIR